MDKGNFTDEFRLDAIKQITERGYSVADISKRLGVSTHSLYGWMKRYSVSSQSAAKDDQSSEIRRLKQELACVTEERDILKKPPRTSPTKADRTSDDTLRPRLPVYQYGLGLIPETAQS